MSGDDRNRYLVLRTLSQTGERLPILVDCSTGIPPRIPLRYSFDQRNRGGSARLEGRLRRIGDLYEWHSRARLADLDQILLNRERVPFQHLSRAVADFKSGSRSLGARKPAAPATINACITAWRDFLTYAALGDNWQSGAHPPETPTARDDRHAYVFEMSALLNEKREDTPEPTSHLPLAPHELDAVAQTLYDDSRPIFDRAGRERNRLLWRTIDRSGARIGEGLKIKIEDLPPEETRGERSIRTLQGRARYVKIVRRPDDPDDSRVREARVKRGDRLIALPDDLFDDLIEYSKKRRAGSSKYLFISTADDSNSLSISRAEDIIRTIGKAAHRRCLELYPQRPSTLDRLCWHRLRTTRAIEALAEFFPDNLITEHAQSAYLEYFGWSSPDSAEPYLRSVRAARAAEHIEASRRALRESIR